MLNIICLIGRILKNQILFSFLCFSENVIKTLKKFNPDSNCNLKSIIISAYTISNYLNVNYILIMGYLKLSLVENFLFELYY